MNLPEHVGIQCWQQLLQRCANAGLLESGDNPSASFIGSEEQYILCCNQLDAIAQRRGYPWNVRTARAAEAQPDRFEHSADVFRSLTQSSSQPLQGPVESFYCDRLQEVIDSFDFECFDRMLFVCGSEHYVRHIARLPRNLQAAGASHPDIQKSYCRAVCVQGGNGRRPVRAFGHDLQLWPA